MPSSPSMCCEYAQGYGRLTCLLHRRFWILVARATPVLFRGWGVKYKGLGMFAHSGQWDKLCAFRMGSKILRKNCLFLF